MDLDLAQVRAFVATAEQLHFGRAARLLFLSQQALSKRVARLEEALGVRLFVRRPHAVELTDAGRRFLAPAVRALEAADRAVDAARRAERPLRIDVWGHLYDPMRSLRPVLDHGPGLDVELGVSRDLPAAVRSLARAEIDVGLGRVHPLSGPQQRDLTHRIVRLEPVDAIMSVDHPLADATELRPAELRDSVLWCPADLDRLDFLRHFATFFRVPTAAGGVNLGLDHLLAHVRADPTCFSLLPADVALPDGPPVRVVPLVEPTPLYAWSLAWRGEDPHPGLDTLVRGFAEIGRRRRWLEYRPDHDWLPDADHAELRHLTNRTRMDPL